MRIAKRLPLFLCASVLTFALGVGFTRFTTTKTYCPRFSPWEVLLKFENQDLQGLGEESRRQVEAAVKAITGKSYENTAGEFKPALFRSMSNTNHEQRYVLVELAQLFMIPGSLRVHVFDAAGHLLNLQEFNVGQRMTVRSMRIRKTDLINQQTLIVDSQYCLGGHPSQQFYALVGNGLVLIYLEQDGKLDNNNYRDWHMTIGPKIERSVIEWGNYLSSTDDAEVLSALVWFNGNRPLMSRNRPYRQLHDLTRSKNLWIKTAAESALENTK